MGDVDVSVGTGALTTGLQGLGPDAYSGFVESEYASLLDMAARSYRFEAFGTTEAGPHLLWRHDIDMSPHRALRLAQIEAARGLRATYFVHLHSSFYSVFERAVLERLRRIAGLGHEIGLHFDAGFYGEAMSARDLIRGLTREREILEGLVGARTGAFSFHNPERDGVLGFDDDTYAGMANAYAQNLRSRYAYVSDSNGYWRFRTLEQVLGDGLDRLQVLTHPEWWTPTPMSPHRRVARCIRGRSRAVSREYDSVLAAQGRLNLGKPETKLEIDV